jgi:hypothetical protein
MARPGRTNPYSALGILARSVVTTQGFINSCASDKAKAPLKGMLREYIKSVGLRTSAQALATQKNHFGLNHSHIETDLIAVPCYRIFVIAWHLEVVLLSAIAASAQ